MKKQKTNGWKTATIILALLCLGLLISLYVNKYKLESDYPIQLTEEELQHFSDQLPLGEVGTIKVCNTKSGKCGYLNIIGTGGK